MKRGAVAPVSATKAGTFSFEFFPPKTAVGFEKLRLVRKEFEALGPAYVSVTFGAGGSTQEGTLETVRDIVRTNSYPVAPHLSGIGADRASIQRLLDIYLDLKIKRLVALRGDLPSGMMSAGEFPYARNLVRFIREQTGDHFHIEVGAYPEIHPQATSAEQDVKHFVAKIQAGADSGITQYFFNADAYFAFVDSVAKHGVGAPIIPGIMPINNFVQLAGFSDRCGAEIPRWIRKRLADYGDDLESLRQFGYEVVFKLCRQLLEQGAPGLHFYTMNQAQPCASMWRDLGL